MLHSYVITMNDHSFLPVSRFVALYGLFLTLCISHWGVDCALFCARLCYYSLKGFNYLISCLFLLVCV